MGFVDVDARDDGITIIPDEVVLDPALMSDAELLERCVAQPDLFADFYRRHYRSVLAFLMRRVGCAQTAADLCSETFAAAFSSRATFRPMDTPAQGWLFGIARNLLGKYARRQRVSRKYQRKLALAPVDLTLEDMRRVEELADMSSLRSQLRTAMEALPDSQAKAVELRVIEQLPYEEVAGLLGVSEGAVRVRVSRGLTRLAELLEGQS